MDIISTVENGPIVIEPTIIKDERGYFYESFNEKEFYEKTGIEFHPVQDNQSKSNYGVLRGMHFQKGDYSQAKLVRVITGAAVDVVVDCRPESSFFGKTYYLMLSGLNHQRQFFIPKGFAHGFIALRDDTIFQYKCDAYYNKESEDGIAWDSIDFDWKNVIDIEDIILSEKDKNRIPFSDYNFEKAW